ncbi:hypothetical protein [Streptomyces chilikensis]|uniref:Uncharacterized protein n=1 Tax=Streptomyces chilikensis TaxID=1194079 RepID=A0ABV3EIF9_9ACTN
MHEDADGKEGQGAVTVPWGSASGLSGGTTLPGKAPGSWGGMGGDPATGDVNGHGRPGAVLHGTVR